MGWFLGVCEVWTQRNYLKKREKTVCVGEIIISEGNGNGVFGEGEGRGGSSCACCGERTELVERLVSDWTHFIDKKSVILSFLSK